MRALAQRSAEAAKEIKGLILASAEEVTKGVDLVNTSGTAFERIQSQIAAIDSGIAEIADHASSQSSRLRDFNVSLHELDESAHSNAAMSTQAVAACESLNAQCQRLAQTASSFRTSLNEPARRRAA